MGIGTRIEMGLAKYRMWRRQHLPGPMGDFCRAGHNDLLFEDLPLETGDWVLDGGGYKGEWSARVMAEYGSKVLIVEAIPAFAESIANRFRHNKNAEVRCGALSGKDGLIRLAICEDGSSVFKLAQSNQLVETEAIDVRQLLMQGAERQEKPCALVKLNIEGGEYEVLDALIQDNLVSTVRSFLIQFHRILPDCEEHRQLIRRALSDTHDLIFDYAYVWERWDMK